MNDSKKTYQFETKAIHGGQRNEPVTGAVMPPVFLSSTYAQPAPGEHTGFEYSRSQNPTRFAYERAVAALEGGSHGFAFASGMAAVDAITRLLSTGDHMIASDDLYGGTYRLFSKILSTHHGIDISYVDTTSLEEIEAAIKPNTKMIWLETPSNPLLKITDIKSTVNIAAKIKALVVVDNTFATPYNQNPLKLGADIVMHSATKYIGGHSDVVGGVAVVADEGLAEKLGFIQNSVGGIAGPFDSYLALRGIKTLALRMACHNRQALEIATFLESHPMVSRVIYPGLASHPDHALASEQMSGFSGMISFYLKGDLSTAKRFLSQLDIITLAESLGGVESLIEHPAIMTHASVPIEIREKIGITDSLIRLSVGVEALNDLKAALDSALLASSK